MANQQPQPQRKHALLIGINFYLPGTVRVPAPNDLSGPANDVESLETELVRLGWDVKKMTSTKGENDRPVEPDNELPTHENIRRELRSIMATASEGDLFYFHYSGHGSRRGRIGLEGDGDHVTGCALALMDIAAGGAYFTAYDLGRIIKKMCTTRKLRAIVVIDACHSGGGLRDDRNVPATWAKRTFGSGTFDMLQSDYEAKAWVTNDFNVPEEQGPVPGRDAEASLSWLAHPSGCTVLMGCTINQSSHETDVAVGDPRMRGLLSWYLTNIIRSCNENTDNLPSYLSARTKINRSIEELSRDRLGDNNGQDIIQSPVLIGDSTMRLLGNDRIIHRPIVWMHNSILEVGHAQGVQKDAKYAVYSPPNFGLSGFATVTDAGPFKSSISGDWVQGSHAALQQWALPPTKVVVPPAMQEYLNAANTVPGLTIYGDNTLRHSNEAHFYQLAMDGIHYAIRDAKNVPVPNVPTLQNAKAAIAAMSHLARYETLRELDSLPGPNRLDSTRFNLTLYDKETERQIHPVAGTYNVQHLQKLELYLTIANNGLLGVEPPIYVKYFTFTPRWAIVALNGKESFSMKEVTGHSPGICEIHVNNCGEDDLKETIRAFIYQGMSPPIWDEISLPSLDTALGDTAMENNRPVEPIHPTGQRLQENGRDAVGANDTRSIYDDPPRWTVMQLNLCTSPRPRVA